MKRLSVLTMVLLGSSISVSAQTITGTGTLNYVPKFSGTSVLSSSLIFDNGTNIGIGTTVPTYKLDVTGSGRFTSALTINGDLVGNNRVLAGGVGFINSDALQVNGNATVLGNLGGISKLSNNNYSAYSFLNLPLFNSNGWTFYTPNAAANAAVKRFEIGNSANIVNSTFTNSNVVIANGNMVIGATVAPAQYLLAVNGWAIFTKAVVKLNANWPDYVFAKNYKLLPLIEVEKFLNKNKHLPEVPSAREVTKDGIDLGDNQTILLKKIEELTLYVIDLNKRLDEQDRQIKRLQIANKP